ncbi:hypothetical protein JQX13_34165 [Archangium violaceum]|uniref:OB-fold protein n=1 Tax=Archangium violaceum TaxID=83451 RepID=UPI00193BC66B|nr:hypothetical protein [Archangium violaceum]QRK05218.1 hypothetical protein JQX13_34165 [Archangium violaceum]
MALVKCKQCGNEVAANVAACEKCGAARPRGISTGKVLAIVFAGIGLLCVGPCLIGGVVSALENRGTSVSTKPAEVARTVDLGTLLREYSDNEVRADSAFKGHVIQTSGFVGDVKKDIIGDAYITLGAGEPLEVVQVQCVLNKSQVKKAASLSRGARITVRGRVSGLMMNVLVRECELVGL